MKRVLELFPFFLFLLPAFVTIHIEAAVPDVIEYKFVYERIIIFFVVPLILFSVVFLINRSVKKAALIALTLSVIFFYTGELKNWLIFEFPGTIWNTYSFLLPVITLATGLIIYRIIKSKSTFRFHFFIINTALALFIAADVFIIKLNLQSKGYMPEEIAETNLSPCDTCINPDIYYLLFDNYSNSNMLASDFNFSNHEIEQYLKDRGFLILSNSKSNYSYTAFSLGSIFNMSHLKNIDTIHRFDNWAYLQGQNLVYENRVFRNFENAGYHIYNHSIFRIKSHPSSIAGFDIWGYMDIFDQYNLLLKLNQDMGYRLPSDIQKILAKNKIFNNEVNFNVVDSIVQQNLLQDIRLQTNEPKFIYAHFMRPHPPFYTDSTGKLFDKQISLNEAYVHQIVYCNNMLKKITDSIFTYTKKPFIIIIQGDHSYDPGNVKTASKNLSAFNAVYYFNRDYSHYTDTVSSVNTFSYIFNAFFKTKYSLQQNRSYIFK